MSLKDIKSKSGILWELMDFLWHRKLWWLIPMIVILMTFSLLFIFAGSSGIAPFIYSLF